MLASIIVLQMVTLFAFFAMPSLHLGSQGGIEYGSSTTGADISGRTSYDTPPVYVSVTNTPPITPTQVQSPPPPITSLEVPQLRQVFQCSQVLPEHCGVYDPYCKVVSGACARNLESAPGANTKPTVSFGKNPPLNTPAASKVNEGATCTNCINISFLSPLINPATLKFTCGTAAGAATSTDIKFFYGTTEVQCGQSFTAPAGARSALLSTQGLTDTACEPQEESITLTLDCGTNSVSCNKVNPSAHTVKVIETTAACPPELTASVTQSNYNLLKWNARYAASCWLGLKYTPTNKLWRYPDALAPSGELRLDMGYDTFKLVVNCSNSLGDRAKEIAVNGMSLPTPPQPSYNYG